MSRTVVARWLWIAACVAAMDRAGIFRGRHILPSPAAATTARAGPLGGERRRIGRRRAAAESAVRAPTAAGLVVAAAGYWLVVSRWARLAVVARRKSGGATGSSPPHPRDAVLLMGFGTVAGPTRRHVRVGLLACGPNGSVCCCSGGCVWCGLLQNEDHVSF